MLKKFLPYTTLTVSVLLLITAAIDTFSSIVLFETFLFRLAVVAMLLLSFGVTFYSCFSAEMRRPMILLACLLQTPIGGGMAFVLVYDFCYPDQLQMDALLPLITILVAFASAIQAAVLLLCKSIEEDEGVSDTNEDTEDRFTEDDLRPIAGAPKRQSAVKSSRSAPPAWDAEDDLTPIPRKKQRRTASVPHDSRALFSEEASEQSVAFTSVDLLSLLDDQENAEDSIGSEVVAQEILPQTQESAASSEALAESAAPAAEESISEAAETDSEQSDS